MRLRKAFLLWPALGAAFTAAICAGAFYAAACMEPVNYRPRRLSQKQKEAVVHEAFVPKMQRFADKAQSLEPFEFEFSQAELNGYLSSMDEIAAIAPGEVPGRVNAMLDEAGVSEPAVAINPAGLSLMCRLREYNKIVSVVVSFDMPGDGRIAPSLAGVRIGRLPIPRGMVRGIVADLKNKLIRRGLPDDKTAGQAPFGEMGQMLGALLAGVDSAPMDPVFTVGHATIRLEKIELADELVKLRFVPVRRR